MAHQSSGTELWTPILPCGLAERKWSGTLPMRGAIAAVSHSTLQACFQFIHKCTLIVRPCCHSLRSGHFHSSYKLLCLVQRYRYPVYSRRCALCPVSSGRRAWRRHLLCGSSSTGKSPNSARQRPGTCKRTIRRSWSVIPQCLGRTVADSQDLPMLLSCSLSSTLTTPLPVSARADQGNRTTARVLEVAMISTVASTGNSDGVRV